VIVRRGRDRLRPTWTGPQRFLVRASNVNRG
jgi:hypothetical protein